MGTAVTILWSRHFIQDGGVLTVSIDGNFGLCRKKSAGSSIYRPKTKNLMFEDQDVVDNFVLNYKSGSKDKVSGYVNCGSINMTCFAVL